MRNTNLMILDLATAEYNTIIELIRCAGGLLWDSDVSNSVSLMKVYGNYTAFMNVCFIWSVSSYFRYL